MRLRIDPLSEIPIYRQIVNQVRHLILSGNLDAEAQLPSSRNLGMELNVNMLTVQKAYKELREEGLIYNRRGEGSYVLGDLAKTQVICQGEILDHFKKIVQKAALYGLKKEEIRTLFDQSLKEL
jgi:GntR family transcriptional regulator